MRQEQFDSLKSYILKDKFLPVPPTHRNFVSPEGTHFIAEGVNLMEILYSYGLRPEHSLLDVGCGIGRLAIPMTQFMTDEGAYFGLDINLSGIAWCHENLTQKYPNFEFAVINAKNQHYGHQYEYGNDTMQTASIPIKPDRRFDAACTFSLFTHLLWPEVDQYFRIVGPLLKRGAFFLSSLYLMTPAAKQGVAAGTSPFAFDLSQSGPTYTIKGTSYSHAMAHDETTLLTLAKKHGMSLKCAVHYSGWPTGKPGQDLLVLQKL